MGLFRGRAGEDGGEAPAGLLEEQASTVAAQPEVARQEAASEEAATGLLEEQASTVAAQPEVARREVKREARPDPNKPGWGLTIGQEVSKARGDRASQE